MAITRPVRPSLLVTGTCVAQSPRRRYDNDAKRYTEEVTGHEVLISQENGAQLSIRYGMDDALPEMLRPLAVYVDVNESREYGASLAFQRALSPDDLDRINSALFATAGK